MRPTQVKDDIPGWLDWDPDLGSLAGKVIEEGCDTVAGLVGEDCPVMAQILAGQANKYNRVSLLRTYLSLYLSDLN